MELEEPNNRELKAEKYNLDGVKRTTFWKGVKRLFKQYCEVSSIQGLNYAVKDGISLFER